MVELLLAFGRKNGLTAKDMVTADTMDAAFKLKPLEVLLKFKVEDPNVFYHPQHLGADILHIACSGGPNDDDAPRGKWLGFVKYLLEIEGEMPTRQTLRQERDDIAQGGCCTLRVEKQLPKLWSVCSRTEQPWKGRERCERQAILGESMC